MKRSSSYYEIKRVTAGSLYYRSVFNLALSIRRWLNFFFFNGQPNYYNRFTDSVLLLRGMPVLIPSTTFELKKKLALTFDVTYLFA